MSASSSAANAPRWVIAYLWITVAMAAVFSVLAYLKPEVQFVAWPALGTAGALSLAGPLGLYIARNLATVAAISVALGSGELVAIRVALVLRLVTDGIDAVHNALAGNIPGAGFATVMAVIEVFALVAVRKANP